MTTQKEKKGGEGDNKVSFIPLHPNSILIKRVGGDGQRTLFKQIRINTGFYIVSLKTIKKHKHKTCHMHIYKTYKVRLQSYIMNFISKSFVDLSFLRQFSSLHRNTVVTSNAYWRRDCCVVFCLHSTMESLLPYKMSATCKIFLFPLPSKMIADLHHQITSFHWTVH